MLMTIHGRDSLAVRVGLIRGAPYRKPEVTVRSQGCAEVQQFPPLSVICTPRARRLGCKHCPTNVCAPESTPSHRTSKLLISDNRSQSCCFTVVRVPWAMLLATSTLLRNYARLNHMLPIVQYKYPSSDIMIGPQSLSL